MNTIWFVHKGTAGYHRIDLPYIDTAWLVWDMLNANDEVAVKSTRL